jgi:hypothetical protein
MFGLYSFFDARPSLQSLHTTLVSAVSATVNFIQAHPLESTLLASSFIMIPGVAAGANAPEYVGLVCKDLIFVTLDHAIIGVLARTSGAEVIAFFNEPHPNLSLLTKIPTSEEFCQQLTSTFRDMMPTAVASLHL